jgi:hypothetical protein
MADENNLIDTAVTTTTGTLDNMNTEIGVIYNSFSCNYNSLSTSSGNVYAVCYEWEGTVPPAPDTTAVPSDGAKWQVTGQVYVVKVAATGTVSVH